MFIYCDCKGVKVKGVSEVMRMVLMFKCSQDLSIQGCFLVMSELHEPPIVRLNCLNILFTTSCYSSVTFRKYFKLECLESGRWDEANCESISCPSLPDVFQGMYTCTNSLYYDTRCTLHCQDKTENVSNLF